MPGVLVVKVSKMYHGNAMKEIAVRRRNWTYHGKDELTSDSPLGVK